MHQDERSYRLFREAAEHYQRGYFAEAIQSYRAGLVFDGARPDILADMAKAYEMLTDWDAALQALDAALKLQPYFSTALRRKQRVLEEKAIFDALIADIDLGFRLETLPQISPSANSSPQAQRTLESDFYTLTYPSILPSQLIAVVRKLVEHTHSELGKRFGCSPKQKVPISISVESGYNIASKTPPMPLWATACYYSGAIELVYRAYASAGIGVLYATIRHEWTHLLVDLVTSGRCPGWFNEGLAQLMSRPMLNTERELLNRAAQNGQLLAPYELGQPFSQLPIHKRRLAYLQSCAVVAELNQRYGFAQIRVLLERLGAGELFEAAFLDVFGMAVAEIQR